MVVDGLRVLLDNIIDLVLCIFSTNKFVEEKIMHKFLITIIIIAFFIGCAGMKPIESTELVLPAHLQRLEDNINKDYEQKTIFFVDYREDERVIWIWIDNKTMELECDYVVVLGIVNKEADKYNVLGIINWKTADHVCEYAYIQYEKYLERTSNTIDK